MVKKKRQTKNSTKDNNEKPPAEDIEKLSFKHTEETAATPKSYTWNVLKNDLKRLQKVQSKYENTEEAHRDFLDSATIEVDLARTKQTLDDIKFQEADSAALAGEETQADYKDAINVAEAAHERISKRVKRYKMMMKTKRLDRDRRSSDHAQVSKAQHHLEDFLYFQESIRRWKRLRYIDPNESASFKADEQKRKLAYKLSDIHAHWLYDLLDYYDERDIGNTDYKQGRHDRLGNLRKNNDGSDQQAPIGWQELHLWTPKSRRWQSGLPKRIRLDATGVGRMIDGKEQFEYNTELDSKDKLEPGRMTLDLDNIEKRRAEIEGKKLEDQHDKGLNYGTHTERRQQEMRLFGSDRPNTSALHNGEKFEDRWGELRTKQGLFIAAKETSWDWLNSYDCLDRVRCGELPAVYPMSAVREQDIVMFPDYPHEDDVDSEEIPASQIEKTVKKSTAKNKKTKLRIKTRTDGDEVHGWQKRKANIDYPYENKEFAQRKKPRIDEGVDEEEKIYTTKWTEETDGRREWHVYQGLSPFSDVDSPPRSPILDGIIEEQHLCSIPQVGTADGVWQVLPNNKMHVLEESKRRCKMCENCRAWWPHSRHECWVAHSEITETPVDPNDTSLIMTKPPLVISAGGVGNYCERLHDHYGLRQPDSQKAQWPKLGIRVPYEPMAFDDMKLRHLGDIEMEKGAAPSSDATRVELYGEQAQRVENGKNNRAYIEEYTELRVAHEFYSLAVPVIKTPQRDWGKVGTTPLPITRRQSGGVYEDEESNDEGDLFRASYEEGSLHSGAKIGTESDQRSKDLSGNVSL
jgi:hypothetical protein